MKTPNPVTKGKVSPSQPNDAGESRIEQRARELGEVRGVGHRQTKDDLQQAEREERGDDLPVSSLEVVNGTGGVNRDPSVPATVPGRHIEPMPADDEQDASARMVEEGVDEAQHDLMLAARRRRQT